MAQSSAANLLTSVDSLFTTQEERDMVKHDYVIDLPPSQISLFADHPYKVRMDEDMVDLAESVKLRGVLLPALVRPMPDGTYQMVSGHRRKYATELAGLPTLPCIVRELTDDEAIVIMVDSNIQREGALPSERAFAYKMGLDAMKRQGQRTDLTSANDLQQLTQGQTSRENIAKEAKKSHETIRLYIRLTDLIPEILAMVDNSVLKVPGKLQMALRPAVELSYLTEEEQKKLLTTMEAEDRTPSHAQASTPAGRGQKQHLGRCFWGSGHKNRRLYCRLSYDLFYCHREGESLHLDEIVQGRFAANATGKPEPFPVGDLQAVMGAGTVGVTPNLHQLVWVIVPEVG